MNAVADILARHAKLKSARRTWEQTWQELAEVLLPRRADFTVQSLADGERRTDNIYDSVPMQARRSLSTAIDSLIKPRNVQWFHTRPRNEDLAADEETMKWSELVSKRMFNAIYAREARFIQRSGEVDNDLVTFGTGVLFIGEAKRPGSLLFRSFHLRDTLICESSEGVVDTVMITMKLSVRQAAQRYGEENLGPAARDALRSGKTDQEFDYLWVVMPREDADRTKLGAKNMPWASIVIETESETRVRESGFEEFPFAIPRWDTASGEIYGRSPGHLALPDAETLQAMGKTLLVAGQRATDPPLWVLGDGLMSAARTFPGGITYIDGAVARQFGRVPVGELQTSAQIPVGREMQNDLREQIWGAFFRNVLQLPIDAPRMTATEIIERKEEMLRSVGPVFGQLETDYLAVVVERVFGIMFRAGAFPPPPDVLLGQDIDFRFESPILRAKNQIETVGLARQLETLALLMQAQPEMMDNFDGDAIARATPLAGGFPHNWLIPVETRDAKRKARAEQAQMAQMAEMANQVGGAMGKAAPMLQGAPSG
jgi:hypothetical protein